MSVSITHDQVRSVITGPTPYQLVDTVSETVIIPMELFTFAVDSSAFDHVATVADIQTYPVTRAAAVTAGQPYYRQAAVTVSYATLQQGIDLSAVLLSDLRTLANAYNEYLASFEGTTSETITNTN